MCNCVFLSNVPMQAKTNVAARGEAAQTLFPLFWCNILAWQHTDDSVLINYSECQEKVIRQLYRHATIK